MKKQTLKLEALEVKSFCIKESEKKDKIKGGGTCYCCWTYGCYSDNYTCNGGPC